eukprot:TRINITY_DN34412_c0_g1_i1.p1 TRINITY_DN34412_c0_g1~~TRINITY_DN34412_c0_g1_i1.p1  ORF type:complete len:338 (+),score=66.00 TRINITY_DN34412_c0_g1_i1:40-1014(+)
MRVPSLRLRRWSRPAALGLVAWQRDAGRLGRRHLSSLVRRPEQLCTQAAERCATRRRQLAASAQAHGERRGLRRTDEGLVVHEASPYAKGDALEVVWGNIIWDSGVSLAKFFHWNEAMSKVAKSEAAASPIASHSVLELGAGTGIVGLSMAQLGARVVLTDYEAELCGLMMQNAAANDLEAAVTVCELDWKQRGSYLSASSFDVVVAADVIYSGKEVAFLWALDAHLAAGREAFVASPYRGDSVLSGFFRRAHDRGLWMERLEDDAGRSAGGVLGQSYSVFDGSRFVPVTQDRFDEVATNARFTDSNTNRIQIFRLGRLPRSPT